jgi:hypothetical protein
LDGAELRRFIWLPPGSVIDTADTDYWIYPVGTRAWQELTRVGLRVETRFIEKRAAGSWSFMTYRWQDDDEALAVVSGFSDVRGTGHEIPHLVDCGTCHGNVPDRLLGVTALQLDHAGAGLPLEELARQGLLSARLPPLALPGDAPTQAALGYLHANCGSCHNPRSVEYRSVDIELWLSANALGALEETPAYRTTVGVRRQALGAGSALPPLRISAGNPAASAVYARMASRDPNVQMPPLGTLLVDAEGLEKIGAWIGSLSAGAGL